MEDLLRNKLKAAEELKTLTLIINELSLIFDYNRVNSLIDERQQYIDKINIIDEKIIEAKCNTNYVETNEIKQLDKDIRKTFKEIYEIDKAIRKNLITELKTVKEKLNYSDTNIVVNIKV
jgi:hypothetical protein